MAPLSKRVWSKIDSNIGGKHITIVATWNFLTVNMTGKVETLVQLMKNIKFYILGWIIYEARWIGAGEFNAIYAGLYLQKPNRFGIIIKNYIRRWITK